MTDIIDGHLSVASVGLMIRAVRHQEQSDAKISRDEVLETWLRSLSSMSDSFHATSDGQAWGGRISKITSSQKTMLRLYDAVKRLERGEVMILRQVPVPCRDGYAGAVMDRIDDGLRIARHLAMANKSAEEQAASLQSLFPSIYGPPTASFSYEGDDKALEEYNWEIVSPQLMEIHDANLSIVGTANIIKANKKRERQRPTSQHWVEFMKEDSDGFHATVNGQPWGGCSRYRPLSSGYFAEPLQTAMRRVGGHGTFGPAPFHFGLYLFELDNLDWGSRLDDHMELKGQSIDIQKQSLQKLLPIAFPVNGSQDKPECSEADFLKHPIEFLRARYELQEIDLVARKDRWQRQLDALKRCIAELQSTRQLSSDEEDEVRVTRAAAARKKKREEGPARPRKKARFHSTSSQQHHGTTRRNGQQADPPQQHMSMAQQSRRRVLCAKLGLASNAPPKEVKKAYFRLSKQVHPDKQRDDPSAAAKFIALKQTFDLITTIDADYSSDGPLP